LNGTDSDEVGAVKREFILTPMFQRWRQRLPRRMRVAQASSFDLENLPPDTFVIYPDRMGNYLAESTQLSEDAFDSGSTKPELELSAVAGETTYDYLRAAQLSLFVPYTTTVDVVQPEDLDQTSSFEKLDSIADTPNEVELVSESFNRNALSVSRSRFLKWSALRPLRPTIVYVAAGFFACVMMFAIPGLRRPALTQPSKGINEISQAGAQQMSEQTASKELTERTHTVTAERRVHHATHEAYPEVVVHHYGQRPHVVTSGPAVKVYSDLR
jgi:hypothetical protein